MKNVPVSKLVPGMITAADIFEDTQKLVLPKGVVLTDKTITRLEFYSFHQSRRRNGCGFFFG